MRLTNYKDILASEASTANGIVSNPNNLGNMAFFRRAHYIRTVGLKNEIHHFSKDILSYVTWNTMMFLYYMRCLQGYPCKNDILYQSNCLLHPYPRHTHIIIHQLQPYMCKIVSTCYLEESVLPPSKVGPHFIRALF